MKGQSWLAKCGDNKDVLWGLLRIYFGFALVVKGFVYMLHSRDLAGLMDTSGVPLSGAALAQLVAICHIAGGLMLAFGFLARWGALIQIPNLVGAIFFVHLKAGLFTQAQGLEFTLLVLALLVMFAVGGAGGLSVDWYFEEGHVVKAKATHDSPDVTPATTEPHPAWQR